MDLFLLSQVLKFGNWRANILLPKACVGNDLLDQGRRC